MSKENNNPADGSQAVGDAGNTAGGGGAPVNPSGNLLEAHGKLVKEYFQDHPNPRVNGVAIGYLPGDESPEILVFVDPGAANCESDSIEQSFQQIAPNQPHTLLRASRFVALSAIPANSVSPYAPLRYNLPPVIAGTLGAVVEAGGLSYALTSNHVLAHNGRARQGTPVVLPGPLEDTTAGSVIAKTSHFVELQPPGWPSLGTPVNVVDCALAEATGTISSGKVVTALPYPFPVPAPATPPPNPPPIPAPIPISKSGRTTGSTDSKVSIFRWSGHIDMSFGLYYFQELMGTYDGVHPSKVPTSPASVFAAPGDSGALAVNGKQGVGLVTARGYVFNNSDQFVAYVILICSLDLVQRAIVPSVGQVVFHRYP